ncbi:hypothetical protein H4R21_001309 [Coemansia helicoidea]|uniref:Uncharacterized protein n=1 Tax=Coemansia helicoidea TaxID=1286919 RepID=A0ACC1LCI7_9FUNG|nr:hypothetical protein H4R21_001309 [Coemansia helicoidea]
MHPDFHHFDDNNVDMAKYTDDIAEVGDALAALMPDLRRLECGGADSNPIARSLYGRLASNYAGQLEWLDSGHAIAVPPDCHFTRLKKAVVSYGDVADYQLPRMVTGELTAMSLLAAPSNHSWAPFSTSSGSQVIEFPRLRQLFVGYRTTYLANGIAVRHRDGHPWRLHFPRLESLRIHNSQQACPLLEYATLPAHMESIYISMESAAYLNIASVVLPAAKRIDLHITPESHGDTSGLPAINRILESARGAESLELAVEDNTLRVGPGSITCTALTQLAISAPTSVDTMLSLIEGLPNLVKLTVLCLDLSGIQADVSVPGADADASVEPLSMSLESLLIYHDSRGHSPDAAVAVLTHMLLRIPTLSEVYSPQTPEGPVKGFVESYVPRYPHLSGVELTLCRS